MSSGDIPDDFVRSRTYALPVGPGHRANPGAVAGKLAAGWEVAGIVSLQSGLPLAVTQVTNFNSFAGFGTQRPNRLRNPTCLARSRPWRSGLTRVPSRWRPNSRWAQAHGTWYAVHTTGTWTSHSSSTRHLASVWASTFARSSPTSPIPHLLEHRTPFWELRGSALLLRQAIGESSSLR